MIKISPTAPFIHFTYCSICHAPRTAGNIKGLRWRGCQTWQRRSDRAPQGSPLVFRRPWGSIFKPPRSRRARNATSGIKDSLIAPKQLVHHLPGCFFLAPSLTRSYTGYVPLILCIQLSWCLKETVRNLRPSMCRRWESLFVKYFLIFFDFFHSLCYCTSATT